MVGTAGYLTPLPLRPLFPLSLWCVIGARVLPLRSSRLGSTFPRRKPGSRRPVSTASYAAEGWKAHR